MKRRFDIEHTLFDVIENSIIRESFIVLKEAMRLNEKSDIEEIKDFELLKGNVFLCRWWNSKVPEHMKYAATFSAFYWDEANSLFYPFDENSPPMRPHEVIECSNYAFFNDKTQEFPPTIVFFLRGKKDNYLNTENEVVTLYADGTEHLRIYTSDDLRDVDLSPWAYVGLKNLKKFEKQTEFSDLDLTYTEYELMQLISHIDVKLFLKRYSNLNQDEILSDIQMLTLKLKDYYYKSKN